MTCFTHSTALSPQHPPAPAVPPQPGLYTAPAKNPLGTKSAAPGTWQDRAVPSSVAQRACTSEDLDSQALEMTTKRAAARVQHAEGSAGWR